MSLPGLPNDAYREACYRDLIRRLPELNNGECTGIEVSGTHFAALFPAVHWRQVAYPQVDITDHQSFPGLADLSAYDIVAADQVLEHVTDPFSAVRNLAAAVKEGGVLVVTTVFMFPAHSGGPDVLDYWRFTPDSLKLLLGDAGLQDVVVCGWGGRDQVNLVHDWPTNAGTMEDRLGPDGYKAWLQAVDPACPIVLWAVGRVAKTDRPLADPPAEAPVEPVPPAPLRDVLDPVPEPASTPDGGDLLPAPPPPA